MYVLTELRSILICQTKEKEKNNIVLKMLLSRRAKARQEIKSWISQKVVIILN